MSARSKPAEGAMTLAEMKEFAGFAASTQRYIRRSLDVGLDRFDTVRAAAGHPHAVFDTSYSELAAWTGAALVDVAER